MFLAIKFSLIANILRLNKIASLNLNFKVYFEYYV